MLLAFMNKALSAILTIDRILKTDVQENFGGFLRNLYIPLYSLLKTLFDCFKYLVDFLPTEVLQKYKKKPADEMSYFFKNVFYNNKAKVKV